MKGITTPNPTKKLKGTKGCIIKHFAFYYNNKYLVYKEAKYSASYWPQKLNPKQFKGTKKEKKQNYFDELDKNLMSIHSQ